VVEARGGEKLNVDMTPIEYGLTMSVDAVRAGDFGELVADCDRASDELARQLVGLLVENMKRSPTTQVRSRTHLSP
jgi:hypothetical protein